MTGDPCTNSWYGVDCTSGIVGGLRLDTNNLIGTLPTDVEDLTGLTVLRLDNNPSVTGTIPSELGTLPALEYFYGNSNAFSGCAPSFPPHPLFSCSHTSHCDTHSN